MSVELKSAVITEADVDRAAMSVIEEFLGCIFDYCDSDDGSDHARLVTLGEINGAIYLANKIKKRIRQ